jgi:hypothetical protein
VKWTVIADEYVHRELVYGSWWASRGLLQHWHPFGGWGFGVLKRKDWIKKSWVYEASECRRQDQSDCGVVFLGRQWCSSTQAQL